MSLLEANNRTPNLSCAVHDPAHRDEVLAALRRGGFRIEPGELLKSAFIASGGSPARTEAFRRGSISIQDEASQAIPLLLGVQPGDSDSRSLRRSGRQNSTAHPLPQAGMGWWSLLTVTHTACAQCASSSSGLASKACRSSNSMPRATFPSAASSIASSSTRPVPALGRWHAIRKYAGACAPSSFQNSIGFSCEFSCRRSNSSHQEAHLVYSTCSMEPEENEEVVSEALASAPSIKRVTQDEIAKLLAPHLIPGIDPQNLIDADGQFRTSPAAHHTDGFFAAVLEKPGAIKP